MKNIDKECNNCKWFDGCISKDSEPVAVCPSWEANENEDFNK